MAADNQGRIQGGPRGPCPPQDAEVAFWSTAIILIQLLQQT